MSFDRNMLPLLGVSWNYFPTLREAERFAEWAECQTCRDQYPCETDIEFEDYRPVGEQYVVKVSNW